MASCSELFELRGSTVLDSVEDSTQYKGSWFFGGLRYFQKKESQLKTKYETEYPQIQEPIKMSKLFRKKNL